MTWITAAWFTPNQQELADLRLADLERSGHLVFGGAELDTIEELRAAGLVVRSARESPPEWFESPVSNRFSSGVRAARVEADADFVDGPAPAVYVASLAGPLFPSWAAELANRGLRRLSHLGEDVYTLRGSPWDPPSLDGLPYILGFRPYTNADTWYSAEADLERLLTTEPALLVELELHPDATPLAQVISTLGSLGVEVLRVTSSAVLTLLPRSADRLGRVAGNQDVALIHEFHASTPANDHVRRLVGVSNLALRNPGAARRLDGAGEWVAVADSGVDDQHAAFGGRVMVVDMGGRNGVTSDPTGHGTHVAATVGGAGTNPGAAPAANLYVQSLIDSSGRLGGANDVAVLLADAYRAGARVHNNSWTRDVGDGVYDGAARAIDEFVRTNRDMVVVVAAGNHGRQLDPAVGEAAPVSVASPATAKSALGVGASCSDRVGVVAQPSPQTWGTWFRSRFTAAPIANATLAGSPTCLDARSGRGPCRGTEILKPDLVAPGTFIRSARATTASPGQGTWADDPGNQDQVYRGGTSMAAAVVSGGAALVRQYLRDPQYGLGVDPSAALVRAVLINGTDWLAGGDAALGHTKAPNMHQGFGRLNLEASLPAAGGVPALAVVDDLAGVAGHDFHENGEQMCIAFEVGSTVDLRVCLVWDDPPYRAVQNRLMLALECLGTSTRWVGNEDAQRAYSLPPGSLYDDSNPVQVVRIVAPSPGEYLVTVTAMSEILDPPQPFSLAVTGHLLTPLTVTGP